MDNNVQLYTDGACKGNPGIGGWGVLIQMGNYSNELKGFRLDTTNNQMELMAVIKGLEAIEKNTSLEIITDSQYVMNGMKQWIINWKKNGWKTASKKPVKNKELWQRLDGLVKDYTIHWKWVKGHSGHPGNERADQLANEAIEDYCK
tara:strand:- start:135 stop:575 length:441 start_codon:yes stop_codon:yes gene_type:complete